MDVRMPDGTIVTNVPDNTYQEDLLSSYASYAATPVSENPIYGVAANITPSLASGIGSLLQMPGKAADLVTGTAPGEKAGALRTLAGLVIPGGMKSVQEAGASLEEVGQAAKTLGLQQKEADRARRIADTEGEINKFGTAFSETFTDPALLSSFVFETIPNAFGTGIGGMIAKGAGKLLFKNASEAALGAMGVSGTVATGAAMQGADIGYETYKDIYESLIKSGETPESANIIAAKKGRVAALEAGGLSYAMSRIPGAREFEKSLFKGARQSIPKAGATSTAKGVVTGALGGGASEVGEEVGGKFASNVGKQEVFPETELMGGTGETAAMALLGGMGLEGVGGGINARSQANAQKRDTLKQAAETRDAAIIDALKGISPEVALVEPNVSPVDLTVAPQELFYSEQPLPQEILDEGYTLVGQQDDDGQTYYAYSKDAPIEQASSVVEPPVAEPPTVAPVSAEPTPVEAAPQAPTGQLESAAPVAAPLAPIQTESAAPIADPIVGLPPAESAVEVPNEPVVRAKRVAAEPTARYGITDAGETGVPTTEGGNPFKTRKEAEAVKALQPQLRILPVKVKGKVLGYVLADKTKKQLAAEKVGAQRLQSISVGGLLKDILSQGGINPVHRAELGFSETENPIIGNRRLFAAQGNGASLASITESQEESSAAESEYTGRDIAVQQSLPDRIKQELRQYNSGGVEVSGVDALEQKLEAEYQDFLAAEQESGDAAKTMLDAGYTQQDLNVVGFTKASPELQAEVAALEAQMEAMGLDSSGIIAEISFTPNITQLEYYTRAKSELTKAIAQATQQRSGGNVSKANVSSAPEGITSPSEKELKDKQAAIDKAAADMAAANRAAGVAAKTAADRKEIAARSEKAASEFKLGVSAEDDLSGQKPIFGNVKQLPSEQLKDTPNSRTNTQTNTPAFKKWFGDSKIVDEDGKPLVVYHGTGANIYAFDPQKGKDVEGIFFAPDAKYANVMATRGENNKTGNVMPVYVSIKTPRIMRMAEYSRSSLSDALTDHTNDGVLVLDDNGVVEIIVAKRANQIKSAIGNNGEFSEDLDDIRYSVKTTEQQENAGLVAKHFSGKIVYQNGDISLTQGRDAYGNPMYLPAKGVNFYSSSIETLKNTSALFTKEEAKELLGAQAKIESEDAAKHAAKPFVTFSNGVATSKNITPELAGIFKQWKSLLKLNQNIYLSTVDDALSNKDNFAGPQRRIGNAAITMTEEGTPGITQSLADGTRYILISHSPSSAELVEILAHEMGHAHQQEVFNNAPAELQKQIKTEFEQWLNSQKGKTVKEFIYALRAKETAETTSMPRPSMPAKDMRNYAAYWASFSEWYADQTARWATTSEKPLTAVDRFFAKVAESLRNFFKSIQSAGFLPNATFKQYMDDITGTEIVAANIFVPSDEQLPLFASKTVQSAIPGTASIAPLVQAPTVPSTGTPRLNITGTPIAGTWAAAPDTTLTPWIYKFQDKQVDLKDAQKQIEKTVGKIDDAMNAYRKETLYYGRVADQTEQFLNKELKPLLQEMVEKKLTLDEVDKYLQALHAEERNKSIAKKVNGMQDGGAGITTAAAKAYLAGLSPAMARDLQSISQRVRKIISGTQDIEVKGGLDLQSKIDGWNKAWPNYVPLFRDEVDYVNSGSGMGQGFSTRGSSSKRAVGSDKPVKEIIASLSDQRQKAIVRSEKARVGKSLFALAVANPNPDFWLAIDPNSKSDIKKAEQMLLDYGYDPGDIAQLVKNMAQEPRTGTVKRVFNPTTKQFDEVVKYEVHAQNRYSSNVLAIRNNGEDQFLFFNPSNDRAKRMAEAIKNLDAEQLGEVTQTLGSITRFIAALSTQYNPIFGVWNFARDVQGAVLNLTTTPLRYKKAEVFSGAFKALSGIYKETRARRAGGQISGYYSDLYRDFESVGGKTGFMNQFSNLAKKGTVVERELKGLTQGRVKGAVSAVGGWMSDYNDTLENAVRLSSYEQGLKMGLSKEESADIAKNLTVNFNRKGAKTAGLGALYAFFNSSVQGITNMYKTLAGPAGKKIIAGGFLLGAFQAAILSMAGLDEDEPSEFIKQKNLIIPTLGGGYIMIPMPLGFNILPNVGRIISEIAFGNKKSASRKTGDLLEAVVSSFNPLGGGNMVQMAMPTVLDPIANVIINKDSFGRPISREDRGLNPSPGYLRSRESAGAVAKGIAEFLNYVSGGTEFNKGGFSPTGDDINYVVGQYLGGVGREAMRAKEFVASAGKEEPFEPYKVPILGKLYGNVNAPASVASSFYLNIKQMAEHENEIKGRKGSAIGEYMRNNPDSRLYKSANKLENEISKLNKTKRQFIERDAPEAVLRRIEDQKLRMMKQFNEQVRKLQ